MNTPTPQAPAIKGFSDKNLWRMKQFYDAYQGDETLSTLLRELPWSHNLAIFSRCKAADERRFYLALAAKERCTFRELDRQINASTFERTVAAPAKLSTALREMHPTLDPALKDRYVLEFLGLPEPHSENDLKRALVAQYQLQLPDKKWIAARLYELLALHDGMGDE